MRAEYGELGLLWLMTDNAHGHGFAAQYDVAVKLLERLLSSKEKGLRRRF